MYLIVFYYLILQFVSINELNRIYINDALKCKQLCEIVLPQTRNDQNDNHNNSSIQVAFLDNARSIIIGGSYKRDYRSTKNFFES